MTYHMGTPPPKQTDTTENMTLQQTTHALGKNPQQSVLQQSLFVNSDHFFIKDVGMLRCGRQMKNDSAFVIHYQ